MTRGGHGRQGLLAPIIVGDGLRVYLPGTPVGELNARLSRVEERMATNTAKYCGRF